MSSEYKYMNSDQSRMKSKLYDDLVSALRKQVLEGDFSLTNGNKLTWKSLGSSFMVFVSSTFTDTHEERDFFIKLVTKETEGQGAKIWNRFHFC